MTAQDDPGTIVKTSRCPKHGQNRSPRDARNAAATSVYLIYGVSLASRKVAATLASPSIRNPSDPARFHKDR
jgi:hypothetical protein